jgi:hypothetical protein
MRAIILIIVSTALISCGHTNKPEEQVNITVQKKDTCRDNYTPDIKVNNIELSNNNTSLSNYKNIDKLIVEDNQGLPYASFLNKNKTEKLSVYFFYGSGHDEFYQFKIEAYNGKKFYNQLEYKNFITESGIKLGTTKTELLKIKGNTYTENEGVVKYVLSDYNNSCFLQKYNLPVYFSEYTFKDDKLIKIYFGFEYP